MGGSGYNTSLSVGRSVRRQANSRNSIWFWLDGPFYVYDMGCGPEHKPHEYRSRTPLLVSDEDPDGVIVWCGQCLMFQYLGISAVSPVLSEAMRNRGPLSKEEIRRLRKVAEISLPPEDFFRDKRGRPQGVAIMQDNNVLRERVARELQNRGFVQTDAEIMAMAVEFGLPVAEIKWINAGLAGPDNGVAGQIETCRAGLHEMTLDNILVKSGRRTCKACYREKDRRATQARRTAAQAA